jgi:hypothetical protein
MRVAAQPDTDARAERNAETGPAYRSALGLERLDDSGLAELAFVGCGQSLFATGARSKLWPPTRSIGIRALVDLRRHNLAGVAHHYRSHSLLWRAPPSLRPA